MTDPLQQHLHASIPCHYCGRDTVGFDRDPVAETPQGGLQVHLRCGSCGWCFRLDIKPAAGGRMALWSRANVQAPEGLSQLKDRPLCLVRAPDPAVKEPVELFPTLMEGRYAGVPGLDVADGETCRHRGDKSSTQKAVLTDDPTVR
jgi:hypothetical protein